MWSYLLTGTALLELHVLAGACTARYAHTFVCGPGVPFERGGWRSNKAVREVQRAYVLQDLYTWGRTYIVLTGSAQERAAQVGAALGPAPGSRVSTEYVQSCPG